MNYVSIIGAFLICFCGLVCIYLKIKNDNKLAGAKEEVIALTELVDIWESRYNLQEQRHKRELQVLDEYTILKNLDPKWKYIARNEDGGLWLYEDNPLTNKEEFFIQDCYFSMYNHLFSFVKDEDGFCLIADLLKGEQK